MAVAAGSPAPPWIRPDWPAPPGVQALATLRHGAGVSPPPYDSFNFGLRSGDETANVLRNRGELRRLAGLPSSPHWLQQVHGIGVRRFDVPAGDTDPDAEPVADAAVSSVPGVVLAVLSADCLPLLLAARDGSEVAAAHCSWRTLAAGLVAATLAQMRTPPAQLVAWLGPAAGAQAYEVGAEVFTAFVEADPAAAAAFRPTRPGHWLLDLYALTRRRLAAAGVTEVNGGGFCTISEPERFHSYRRDGQRSGRLASLVWIAPGG